MKYEVETWNEWDYPSYWRFEESFRTEEEAVEYAKNFLTQDKDYIRIIQVIDW